MGRNDQSPVSSDRVKKALCWMAETIETHPEKKRETILQEAELRFDLSPAECAFLNKNFSTSCT